MKINLFTNMVGITLLLLFSLFVSIDFPNSIRLYMTIMGFVFCFGTWVMVMLTEDLYNKKEKIAK